MNPRARPMSIRELSCAGFLKRRYVVATTPYGYAVHDFLRGVLATGSYPTRAEAREHAQRLNAQSNPGTWTTQTGDTDE